MPAFGELVEVDKFGIRPFRPAPRSWIEFVRKDAHGRWDHDARSYELIARVFAGGSEGLTRDDVLDNITVAWLTNTALSGARLYWENKGASFFAVRGVVVPTAVSVFPDELYPTPRSWAERAFPKLIHYNQLPKGGHFAAWEQPKLFSEEVRAGFRSVR